MLFGVGIGLVVLAGVLWLVSTFGSLLWLTILQWRDVISLDRWAEVLSTIGRNKLRTALTTISVAWGIFVLVILLGAGRGLDNGARHEFARDATNGVWIFASKTSVAHDGYEINRKIQFDNRDYARAVKVPNIDHISGQFWPQIDGMAKRGAKANVFDVNCVHADAIYLGSNKIAAGRWLSPADIAEQRKNAVVGQPVVDFLFEPGENPIGQWIEISGIAFQVVGVFTNEAGQEQERQIYVPVSTAQLAWAGADHLNMLEFTVGDEGPEETQAIIDTVVGQLAERHQFDPNDKQAARVHNSVEQFQRFKMIFWMLTMFITVIGLGTLAAGVVGVSNIMMIAVKERTKEIGVRKALGATPNSIVFMVIQEAVFLTGIAGLLGLAGGVGALELLNRLHLTDFLRDPSIDLKTGIAATLFLICAGALAGYFPARAAAKVNPIHALRDQ